MTTKGNGNTLLISGSRKPITYMGVCQRMLSEHGEVKMSALGAAMSALVTVAEILKSRGLAVEKKITTSLEELESDNGEGTRKKPKLEIVMVKTENFEEIAARDAAEREKKREEREAAEKKAAEQKEEEEAKEEK